MIRIIVREQLICPEGSIVESKYKTFDIQNTDIEECLRQKRDWCGVSVIGAEVLDNPPNVPETPWAELTMRVPDENAMLEPRETPRCKYCGEWYAVPDNDAMHSRNCNRPKA